MGTRHLRLVVLLSGTGRTLVNLQDLIAGGALDAEICLVISSRGGVKGVSRAEALGLPTTVIEQAKFTGVEFQQKLTGAIAEANPDLVCMAGFLSLWHIPAEFHGRVINIHPALLPEFGGRGMYGQRVHEAVLRAGSTVSGCTVHFCDNEYDSGPIILQRQVAVKPDDTPDTLATRIFTQECIAYPDAIRLFIEDRIRVEGRTVTIA